MINNIGESLLKKSLDGLWVKQQATTDNIANSLTPGYKAKTVDFETHLRSAMKKGLDGKKSELIRDIEGSSTITKTSEEQSLRLDGNNVDLEKENMELAKTQLQYMYTVTELNSYFSKMRSVISEGKK